MVGKSILQWHMKNLFSEGESTVFQVFSLLVRKLSLIMINILPVADKYATPCSSLKLCMEINIT